LVGLQGLSLGRLWLKLTHEGGSIEDGCDLDFLFEAYFFWGQLNDDPLLDSLMTFDFWFWLRIKN
jgi:hypothetical protein